MTKKGGDAGEEALRAEFEQVVQTLVNEVQKSATGTVQSLTTDISQATGNLREMTQTAEAAMRQAREAAQRHERLEAELQKMRNIQDRTVRDLADAREQIGVLRTTLKELTTANQVQAEMNANQTRETGGAIQTMLIWFWLTGLALVGGMIYLAKVLN